MPELDRKSTSVFAGKVVRKDLVRKVKVGANVPVFVLEYLLGKYCATDDPAAIDAGLRVVNTTLTENFVRPDEANAVQSKVKDKGKYTLIDKIKVRYLSDDDKHWAELVNFGHKNVHVPEHYLREFDRLLMGGVWAQVEIRHQYDEEQKGKRSPFWIDSLKPIQLANFDFDEYRDCRVQFNTEEWIDLLLRTIGMEPSHFDRRLKLLFLTRLGVEKALATVERQQATALIPVLAKRYWSLWLVRDNAPNLVCSDSPVYLGWTKQMRDSQPPGLGVLNTIVTVPLSRRIALVGTFEPLPKEHEVGETEVARLNSSTTMYGSVVYSAVPDFVWLTGDGKIGNRQDFLHSEPDANP